MSANAEKPAEAPQASTGGGGASIAKPPAAGEDSSTKAILRYRKEFLLKCAKSPLVTKPRGLLPKEAWFGSDLSRPTTVEEPAGSADAARDVSPKDVPHINTLGPMLASLLNKEGGFAGIRGDKNIVLGPPKLSFASSQKQGFANYKKTEENDWRPGPSRSSRHTTSDGQQEVKSRPGEYGSRPLRGAGDRERGPGPRKTGYSERHGPLQAHGGHGHAPRDSGHGQTRDGVTSKASFGPSRDKVASDVRFSVKRGSGRSGSPEHEPNDSGTRENPDWMDYDPSQESAVTAPSSSADSGVDKIQLWKQQMKEREQKEREEKTSRGKVISRADASQSWRAEPAKPSEATFSERKSSDRAAEDKSRQPEPALQREPESNKSDDIDDHFFGSGLRPGFQAGNAGTQFEKFLVLQSSEGVGDTAAESESRFSKLFRRTQEREAAKEAADGSERKTSGQRLMDMLNSKVSSAAASAPASSVSTAISPRPLQTPGRVLTEEEVLRQLGAKGLPGSPQAPESMHAQRCVAEEELVRRLGARTGWPAEASGERRSMTGEDLLRRIGSALPQQTAVRSLEALQDRRMMTEDQLLRHMTSPTAHEPPRAPEASSNFNMLMDKLTRGMADTGVSQRRPDDGRASASVVGEWQTADASSDEQRVTAAASARGPQFTDESSPLAAFVKGARLAGDSSPHPPSVESAKARPNLVLDGNVPTSVYRHLSGRADTAKGPAAAGTLTGRLAAHVTELRPASPAESAPLQQHLQNQQHVMQEFYRQQQQQQHGLQQRNSLQSFVSGGARPPSQLPASRPQSTPQQLHVAAQAQQQTQTSAQARIEQFFGLAPQAQQRPAAAAHRAPISGAQSLPPGYYGYQQQQQQQLNQRVNQMQAPLQQLTAAQNSQLTAQQQLALLQHHQLQQQQLLLLHQQHQQQQQHHHPQQQFAHHHQHPHQHQQLPPQLQQFFRVQVPASQPSLPQHQQLQQLHPPHGYGGTDASTMLPGYGGFYGNTPQATPSSGIPPRPQGYITVEELERRRLAQTPHQVKPARGEP